ncbi:MAG: hypothetical protein H7831_13115 [Magnetococcus sp. WYHC-3]
MSVKRQTPRSPARESRTLALPYAPMAMEILAQVAMDQQASPAARVSAANALLERAYGKVGTREDRDGQGEVGPVLAPTAFQPAPDWEAWLLRHDPPGPGWSASEDNLVRNPSDPSVSEDHATVPSRD